VRSSYPRKLLFRKTKHTTSYSLSTLAWRKFKKNRLGFGSLIFIGLTVLVATLGYLITPDQTPFANDQCLEVGLKKPGFTVNMLLVRKNQPEFQVSWLSAMISGKRSDFTPVPYNTYRIQGSYVILTDFTDVPGEHSQERSFHLADIVFPLTEDRNKIKTVGNMLLFKDIYGISHRESISGLTATIRSNNMIRRHYWLGTDRFGRDMLSQLLIGTRVSLSVGLISVFISLVIGIFLGSVSGYFRGWIDQLIVWFINVVWSIPTLLLVIAITFALGKGFWQVFIAVGLTMWVEVARVVRGQILGIREKEFVEAGKALGFSNYRIIVHHILPNIMGVVIVISAANFASAILLEAGLSFLGIGVQPPMPSWGSMIKENYGYIVLDSAYLAILPGFAIMLMVLAFMLIGNALRDALDVKTSS